MSISDNYVPLRQLGNGVTVAFSGSWAMIASAYARVYLESVATGVQTRIYEGGAADQYTLSFNSSGFTVTFNTAPTSAYYVVVGRNVAQDQTDPYRTSKGFQGDKLENSLDKLTAICQDIDEINGRVILVPLGDSAPNLQLPTAAARALQYFGFDVDGSPLMISGTSGPPLGAAGGDLTGTYPNPSVASGSISNAKLANMAAGRYKMCISGGAPVDATSAQATAGLDVATGDSGSGGLKGLMPAPSAGDARKILAGSATYKDRLENLAAQSMSSTLVDFTGIPANVRRVTVVFSNVSQNGTGDFLVQLGSGSIVSTGYVSSAEFGGVGAQSTNGFIIRANVAPSNHSGVLTLYNIIGTNTWVGEATFRDTGSTGTSGTATGNITLSGTLDRFRITTPGGSNTFDNGSAIAFYE